MKNKPGISWGIDNHVNLMRSSKGWLAVYYDDENSTSEIISIFKPKDIVDYSDIFKRLTCLNYNTNKLCPNVKSEIDWTC